MPSNLIAALNQKIEGASASVQRLRTGALQRLKPGMEHEVICCRNCADQMQIAAKERNLSEKQFRVIDLTQDTVNPGAEGDDLGTACAECVCCPCRCVAALINNAIGLILGVICCIICVPICIVVSPIVCLCAVCGGGSYGAYKLANDDC